jgi:plastocyanin
MNRKMELTWYAVSGLALIALVLICGCTGSGPTTGTPTPTQTPSQGNAVSIQNFAFVPPTLQVAAGTTVTWTNLDAVDHQIINDATAQAAQGALFMSNPLPQGATYSFTFTTAGTYPYHCNIHPSMKGTITVT